MGTLSPREEHMWDKDQPPAAPDVSDEELNRKYTEGEWRINVETNREQLPNFVSALSRQNWLNLRPAYQRRPRWDAAKQSKLIESFIMNIPVPPLFVYEIDYATLEVMDGQQRILAIRSFFQNELTLTGLERWPELNGRTYSRLPSKVKGGIDRRSVSYITVLKESARSEQEATDLKQLVFERLNRGGVKLSAQEIRNCIYQGPFNDLLISLSRIDCFREAWGLKHYRQGEEDDPPSELLDKPMYREMKDVEAVLRFFALRHVDHYRRGMKPFLDLYMSKANKFKKDDFVALKTDFTATLENASQLYGDLLFRPWNPDKKEWTKPQVAFADAVLVALWRMIGQADLLLNKKDAVVAATQSLFVEHEAGTFTGRGNSRDDVTQRINKFETMLKSVADN